MGRRKILPLGLLILAISAASCDGDGTGSPDGPDAVTDLAASAFTTTSATLEWTQVDDGTGNPARYALRYGSPTITWDAVNGTEVIVEGTAVGAAAGHTYTGLTAGTTYQFQLVPFRGTTVADAVIGPFSNVVTVTTVAALTAGTATANPGDESVTLTATPATGGTPPYTYQWHRSTTDGFTPAAGNALAGFTSLTEVDDDVANETTYFYRLVASDADGASVMYTQVSAMPSAALLPGTATAEAGDGVVTLSATPATGGDSPYTYQWHRSTTAGFTPDAGNALSGFTTLDEVDDDVTNETTYYYRLVVTDEAETSVAYTEVSATPEATPISAGVASASGSDGMVTLSATEPTGGTPPYSYQWYRSTSSGFTPDAGTVISGFNTLNEVDTDVTNGTPYFYVLMAADQDAVTALYDEVSATPSPVSHPNEPTGLVAKVDHPFDTEVPDGWEEVATANLTIESDADAPLSPSNIGAALFPEGWVGGSGPINIISPDIAADSVYIHFAIKMSEDFDSHTAGTKIFFLTNPQSGNAGNWIYTIASGSAQNPLYFQLRTQWGGQYTPGTTVNYGYTASNDAPNAMAGNATMGDTELVRGEWREIEILLVVGYTDGELHVWMDGKKVMEYTDQRFIPDQGDLDYNHLKWNPTYGGGNSVTVPHDQWMYVDHYYISGN